MSSDGMTSGTRSRPRSARSGSTIVHRLGLGRVAALAQLPSGTPFSFLFRWPLMVRYSLAFTDRIAAGVCLDAGQLRQIASDPIYRSLLVESLRLRRW